MLVRAPGADRSGRPRLSVLAGITLAGRPGDGDIDGIGILRLALVSFPVYFQCKRYAGSVGAGEVRNFRGAIASATASAASPARSSPPADPSSGGSASSSPKLSSSTQVRPARRPSAISESVP